MKKIVLTIGASCSGKSTWAESVVQDDPSWVNINRDDIRFYLFTNGERDWAKYKFNKKNESLVTEKAEQMAKFAVRSDCNIIISDTNLNPNIRQKWKDWAKQNGYEYEEKLFPCDWKELVKRNAQRQGGLAESLLWSQYKRYMQQFGEIGGHKVEIYQPQRKLEYCVIVDIDGTVADMKGVRKPFDWDKVNLDQPRHEVISMLDGLAMRNANVLFMSGRDGVCYDATLEWIENNITNTWPDVINWDLVMRQPNDNRKDDVVKYELYNEFIKDIYNVAAVLDDRKSIIRLWSVLDLPNIIDVGGYQNEF